MTTFYICRHGETENNKNARLSGWIDTPLTEEGVSNANSSTVKLKGVIFDKIISSDLGRAFVTAYLISRELGYTSEILRSKGLREVNYGELANVPISDVIAAGVNIDKVNPTGETLVEMQRRVLEQVDTIAQECPGKTVLLVAHDGTINALYASFVSGDVSAVGSARKNGHDFVGMFAYDNGKLTSFDEITA